MFVNSTTRQGLLESHHWVSEGCGGLDKLHVRLTYRSLHSSGMFGIYIDTCIHLIILFTLIHITVSSAITASALLHNLVLSDAHL